MDTFVIFSEDYFYFLKSFCQKLTAQYPNTKIHGLGIRRKTVDNLVETSELPIGDYSWLNHKENEWLQGDFSQEKVDFFADKIGHQALRNLIICDREFGYGFIKGGVYAQTPLRKLIESDEKLRWVYICNMLEYYFKTLQEKSIKLVFMSEITHIWELGLYHVAKSLNIPCTVPFYSRFGDVFVVTDNPYNIFTKADQLFEKSLSSNQIIEKKFKDLAKSYIQEFRNRPTLVEYSNFFKQQTLQQAKTSKYITTFCKDLLRSLAIFLGAKGTKGFLRQRRGLDILKENYLAFRYSRRACKGIFFENYQSYKNQKFIYFPLHYEPEASTMVFAPKFSNQLTIIEQIAKSMPAGYKLLVKEHIPNTGRRPKGFYEAIRSIPDAVLISPFENNFQMIEEAELTVTITGTAGWEAILMKKPTLIFGKTQYNSLNAGYFLTSDLGDLSEPIKKALATPPVDDKKLELFIAATLQEGVKLPLNKFAYAHYGENGEKFFKNYNMSHFFNKVIDYV